MIRLLLLFFLSSLGICFAQQTQYVDFKTGIADISFDVKNKSIAGIMLYEFEMLQDVDTVFIDARNMRFESVQLDGKHVKFHNNGNQLWLIQSFKKGQNHNVSIKYTGFPKKALYFIDDENGNVDQIWTQGQGKYTSNWLPSIDDMNDKIEFDLTINFDTGYQVIANGEFVTTVVDGASKTWKFNMDKPMSSYLVALAIGNYNKQTKTSKSGVPLEFYYYPEDSLKFESTYRYSVQIFDFLEGEIGIAYPWKIYKQVPVKDFLYAGMENTSVTIFSDALMVDSVGFNDRNYVNVNAHELAHQWFGDLVTETNGDHHWLQEGFATYYALLAEKSIFGDDYYYWKLYEYAQQLLDQERAGAGTSLLDPKSSSLTFYQKGCWALHILKEQVGDAAFKTTVKNYLLKYQFKNVETSDFIQEIEATSGQDLSEFVKVWLEESALPQDVMVKSLRNSLVIRDYEMVDCDPFTPKCADYLASDLSDHAKAKVITQMPNRITVDDFKNAREVRQAIAQNLAKIPLELKKSYESLLKDASYVTIESALYNLWFNFPEDRGRYLNQTKDVLGFSDYNVRLLWLALNLNTIEYQPDQKEQILDELKSYTDPKYGFELRMNAFNYIKLLDVFDDLTLKNLIDGTHHHNWRFQQYAKAMLLELEQDERYKNIIFNIKNKK